MVYNYKEFAKEFANRANKNYSLLNKMHLENPQDITISEVNALITDMYAIIVLPTECFKEKFKNPHCDKNHQFVYKLKKQKSASFNNIKIIINKLINNKCLKSTYIDDYDQKRYEPMRFIYHLRNALSHSGNNGMNFFPAEADNKSFVLNGDRDDIKIVYFYDIDTKKTPAEEFCAKIEIEDLIIIKDNVLDIINYDGFYYNTPPLKEKIEYYEKFLKS